MPRLVIYLSSFALLLNAACSGKNNKNIRSGPPAHEAASDTFSGPIVVEDATIGPGDQIAITVYRHTDLNRSFRVPASGDIFLPLAGIMNVNNLSALNVRSEITSKLSRYLVDPQVNVEVTIQRSEKVMVLGEVRTPGIYLMEAPLTALEACARAGGFLFTATERRVLLLRQEAGEMVVYKLNLDKAVKKGDWQHNPILRKGDVVFVPRSTVTNFDRAANHAAQWLQPLLQIESGILLGYNVKDRISSGTNILIGN